MHFNFIDQVVRSSDSSIVTIKCVTRAEEYLRDHFDTFPVLPGVFMLESMVQAARELIRRTHPSDAVAARAVLGSVRALKYGSFVKPGDTLRVEVTLTKAEDGAWSFSGSGTRDASEEERASGVLDRVTCVSGRFMLRPVLL